MTTHRDYQQTQRVAMATVRFPPRPQRPQGRGGGGERAGRWHGRGLSPLSACCWSAGTGACEGRAGGGGRERASGRRNRAWSLGSPLGIPRGLARTPRRPAAAELRSISPFRVDGRPEPGQQARWGPGDAGRLRGGATWAWAARGAPPATCALRLRGVAGKADSPIPERHEAQLLSAIEAL